MSKWIFEHKPQLGLESHKNISVDYVCHLLRYCTDKVVVDISSEPLVGKFPHIGMEMVSVVDYFSKFLDQGAMYHLINTEIMNIN